jgi:hypothetical protein
MGPGTRRPFGDEPTLVKTGPAPVDTGIVGIPAKMPLDIPTASPDTGLVPRAYRLGGGDGDYPVYRIPIHYADTRTPRRIACWWSNNDALPSELNHCPIHGAVPIVCEFRPEHTMAALPAMGFVEISGAPIPVCEACKSLHDTLLA